MDLSTNPNSHWMALFVEELIANGLESVCVAPGSRSTPVVLALANHPELKIYKHLDERSAGFFGLGLAKATSKPVALVCTSGTAAANFHPAIIEAYYSQIPLMVLTADRPAELRGSGANQTIDQIKMFGDHVRWFVQAPTPQNDASDVLLRYVRTLAARAYAAADGLVKGPVHINFPFRKPLEPGLSSGGGMESIAGQSSRSHSPFTQSARGHIVPGGALIRSLVEVIRENPHGLIVCGPQCPPGDFQTAVLSLSEYSGYPILADSLSNIRHGKGISRQIVIGGYNLWLDTTETGIGHPDIIIRFGSVPTSAALTRYLEKAAAAASTLHNIHVGEGGEWYDDLHITNELIQADPAIFCNLVVEELKLTGFQPNEAWAGQWRAAEQAGWVATGAALKEMPLFDASAVHQVLETLTDHYAVFAGNSMAVRHIDAFDRPDRRKIMFYGNRGASGIDGNISTALGIAASGKYEHVVAILGDITFYHDMNGLLAIHQANINNITFIVLNNDGGSIFYRLPVADTIADNPLFSDLFLMPHGLRFEHAAAMYGLAYRATNNAPDLAHTLDDAFSDPGKSMLIEIQTNGETDYRSMLTAMKEVSSLISEKSAAII